VLAEASRSCEGLLSIILVRFALSMVSLANIIGQDSIEIAEAGPILEHHTRYSDEAMLRLAFDAAFDSENAVTIVCIALAESGGHDDALGYNPPTPGCPLGSMDRGILQINSCYHYEVSDACALNAACSFREAFRISYGGLEYGQWTTYALGYHRQYEQRVREALARMNNDDWEVDP